MNVSFDIPQDIEQQLRSEGVDPNREAREAYLVELGAIHFIRLTRRSLL